MMICSSLHGFTGRWGLLFEYSITCFWVGRYDRSGKACDRLLRIRELPDEHRAQTRRNRRYAIEAQAERLADSVIRMRMPTRS
jgi:hypothetical protein